MPEEGYEKLIIHIQQLEQEKQEEVAKAAQLQERLRQEQEQRTRLQVQSRTMQTLNLGIFSMLELEEMCSLVCESLVYQLRWDTAYILQISSNQLFVLGSYQASATQIAHLQEELIRNSAFIDAYLHKNAISTFGNKEATAASMRSLFQTDEMVAMPIICAGQLFGYLAVCSHTLRGGERSQQDLDFLASVAAQVGQAVQNSHSYRELEEQNIRLKELDELKNSFISLASHQLRTPLSIVKWILSLLQNDKEISTHADQKELIDQAVESNERLLHVVNDMLSVSELQNGKLPFNPQLVLLPDLLEEMMRTTQHQSAKLGIHFEFYFDERLPHLELDGMLMKEAVQNLLDNAMEYNVHGGFVKMAAYATEDTIRIEVMNSGPGIAKHDQKRVFEQFFRSQEALKMHPGGNGLGLYLTREIARLHHGDVQFESEPNIKTVFTIIIPFGATGRPAAPVLPQPPPAFPGM